MKAWLLLLCTATAAAQPAPEATRACVVVFGQGRNVDSGDERANRLWDEVNLSFNAGVAARLDGAGRRTVPLVARVDAADTAAVARQVLSRAASEGCRRIVETSLFADYESRTLVARLRDHPVETVGDGATLRIGAPLYVVERNFELKSTTLDRVKPGLLADEMATELLDHGL